MASSDMLAGGGSRSRKSARRGKYTEEQIRYLRSNDPRDRSTAMSILDIQKERRRKREKEKFFRLSAADILTAGPGDRAPEELDLPAATGKQELLFLGGIAAFIGIAIFLGRKANAAPKAQ